MALESLGQLYSFCFKFFHIKTATNVPMHSAMYAIIIDNPPNLAVDDATLLIKKPPNK